MAFSHGTVVVVYVTHYGPGPRGSKAMISHDEGQTWEDDVYYLDFSEPNGYNQSQLLADGTILTIASRDDAEMTAIRWNPVKQEKSMNGAKVQTNWSQVKQARMKAVGRRRRIIFNDDMYELDREDANTPQGFLKRRLEPLVGTQVDTISFSVLEADAPVYDSKVQPIYGKDAHGENPAAWPNIGLNIKIMAKAGHCPVQVITDFAHEHGMESWAHVRINDVHDSFAPGWLSLWKKQHPELLVNTEGMMEDKALYVTAKDMSHEACRLRKIEIIEEVANRYDIDGFELDYIRHPVLFSRTMRGEPVTPQEVQIMTSLMREIRMLTDHAASRRGRAIIIAVRVPDTIVKSRNIGLDIEQWLEQDLVDILIIGGGYAPFTLDLTQSIELARPYGVPVYPCINKGLSRPLVMQRALASRWLHGGADGIYTWNFGTPFEYKTGRELEDIRRQCYAALYEIGDPQTLLGNDKLYKVDSGPVFHHYNFVSGNPPLPVALKPGTSQELSLRVGDDVEAATQAGDIPNLPLELHLQGSMIPNTLSTTLNGQSLDRGERIVLDAEKSTFMIRYQLGAPLLRVGQNIIEVFLVDDQRAADEAMTLDAIRLLIDHQ